MKRLQAEGTRFVDEDGNQVLLNGLCFICREREKGYLEPDIGEKLRVYAKRGFNLIRLGIFWDGAEPEPGVYDDAYLDSVARVVERAEELGIYVFLDMHQDLFSAKFGDGAPAWAALDEGLPHPENCTIWYEAYLSSPAVIRSADNFWANKAAPDGVGLLDHYEAMWEHIAGRFREFPNLLGFEPMNEPYMGTLAPQTFGEAIARVQELNPAFSIATAQTASPEERALMLRVMTENFAKFDREILMPFYSRMLEAIRKVCDVPLVLGGNIYGTAVKTGIMRAARADETPEPRQFYAPHGYDAVVDTDNYAAYNKENVQRVFAQHRESQEELQMPVIVGEWGNFPSGGFTGDLIEFMSGILEEYLWSSTYHQYNQGMEDDSHYSSLERGYPVSTAGELLEYHYDYGSGRLRVRWNSQKGGKTVLYIPDAVKARPIALPAGAAATVSKIDGAAGGYVTITAAEDGPVEVAVG